MNVRKSLSGPALSYDWMLTCAGSGDERMMQLLRNMNRLLEQHPQSRRRHLAWHTPIIVPVYPQVCLCPAGSNVALCRCRLPLPLAAHP